MGKRITHGPAGFTLIELMVAVGLMIILTSAVVQIFVTSSEVFSRTEGKISIFQNARACMQKLSMEVSGAFPYNTDGGDTTQQFVIDNLAASGDNIVFRGRQVGSSASSPQWRVYNASTDILTFMTTTSWIDTTDATNPYKIGAAKVIYSVDKEGTTNRTILQRRFYQATHGGNTQMEKSDGSSFTDPEVTQTVCYYLADNDTNFDRCRFVVQYLENPGGSSPDNTFQDNDRAEPSPATLPSAIRVVMDVTDDMRREIRTIARTIWLPTSTQGN